MSTKPKKKLEKVKTKKIKRAPIKKTYTEEEIVVLKNKYNDILSQLSDFLSEHNVYEAVPENAKILVFNSDLTFYEMIKVFIFEDIYCALIYDPKINNYLGLITTRDLMILYKYIIDNFLIEKITDFDKYLKHIFSSNKLEQNENLTERNRNNNAYNKINEINIFEHLTGINYIDYLKYAKKKNFKNIHIHSVFLDDNLLDTLQKINIQNIHRLLVEQENKNDHHNIQAIGAEKNEKIVQNKKQEITDQVKNKKRNSKSEKTTTANDSDEENKNNVFDKKKDVNKITEQKEENIIEESNTNVEEKSKDNNIEQDLEKPKKVIKKKIIKKKKKIVEDNKTEDTNLDETNRDNNDEEDTSRDEVQSKKKKIVKIKKGNNVETIDKNELGKNKEESKPKKKKIIKRKRKTDASSDITDQSRTLAESRTDDELAPKSKRIIKRKIKVPRRTTIDVPTSASHQTEEIEREIIHKDGKKIVKKKIIKKKIIKKKKKKDVNDDILNLSEKEQVSVTEETKRSNKNPENTVEISDETSNIKSTTEGGEEQSLKDKYELPKIKMKRNIGKNRAKKTEESKNEEEIKKNNDEIKEKEKKENIDQNNGNNRNNKNENFIEKKDENKGKKNEVDKNKDENNKEKIGNLNKNKKGNQESYNNENRDNNINSEINDDKEDTKKEIEDNTDTVSNIHLIEMKNYIGIVTNETIFEYLVFNYYNNDMKEFNLSLNELLVLGDVPIIKKLVDRQDMKEKVYNTFNKYISNNSDIIPIYNKKEIGGFIFPKDFLYYIYNCESKLSLTNEEFLINLYKDIDEEKPYGKNRVIYMELNDKNKSFYIKELIEKINCSIEKKIILYDSKNNSDLYLISLKTIFRAIVEFKLNNK